MCLDLWCIIMFGLAKGPQRYQKNLWDQKAVGDFVNSSGWNRRLLRFLESNLKAITLEKSRSYSFCALRHPFRALQGCWVSQCWCSWFHECLRNKELLLCKLLHTSKTRPFSVSHCSLCWGCCGTRCWKWGEAGAAVAPLRAPTRVSWA